MPSRSESEGCGPHAGARQSGKPVRNPGFSLPAQVSGAAACLNHGIARKVIQGPELSERIVLGVAPEEGQIGAVRILWGILADLPGKPLSLYRIDIIAGMA